VQHGRRTEVLPPSEWDILSSVVQEALRRERKAAPFVRDLYEFRLLIEPRAAAWMAEHGSDADRAELDELAQTMEELADADTSGRRVMDVDREFHALVARASGNRVLAAVSRDIREILNTLWGISRLGGEERKQVAQQHRRIADAIARRDARAATDAMHDHLVWASQADLEVLEPGDDA
jgi:DNA-binding FadR family transcriptional regulator